MANTRRRVAFGGAFASSVALLLLALATPIPQALRFLILAGVIAAWTAGVCRWAIRRFGRKAIFVIAAVPLFLLVWVGRAWWTDKPNRELIAKVEQFPGISAFGNGTVFVGEINHVYIGPNAVDADVRQFTELGGFDQLRRVHVYRTRISDSTARGFARFASLRSLTFQEVPVSDDALVELERALPNCMIEVLEAR